MKRTLPTGVLTLFFFSVNPSEAADIPAGKWLSARAHVIPKWTAPDGEGYFSIIAGHNQRLYIGTHANGANSWLVEFTPKAAKMRVVVDAHKAIGKDLKGFGAQAKIHSRNNVGPSGKIYFCTKQGYPVKGEKRSKYPGGYPMVYDPPPARPACTPFPSSTTGSSASRPMNRAGSLISPAARTPARRTERTLSC